MSTTSGAGWITVRVVPGADRDAVSASLFEAGAMGVQDVENVLLTQVASQGEADAIVRAVLAEQSAVCRVGPLRRLEPAVRVVL